MPVPAPGREPHLAAFRQRAAADVPDSPDPPHPPDPRDPRGAAGPPDPPDAVAPPDPPVPAHGPEATSGSLSWLDGDRGSSSLPPVAPPGALARPPLGGRLPSSLLDRLALLRDDPRVAAAVVVLLALVAAVLWYRAALSAGASPSGDAAGAAGGEPAAEALAGAGVTTTTGSPRRVVVHVSGAVAAPGVYELDETERVADAVDRAGGPLDTADLDRINLAAPLADGERVHVPVEGEPLPEGVTGPPGAAAGPLDVNAATPEQLEELPGIGPTIARAIVDERERRGGFDSVDELVGVRGIGDAKLADLRGLVTV